MFHCSYITLQQLASDNLSGLRKSYCRFHLKRCSSCQTLLNRIRQENEEINTFARSYNENINRKNEITRIIETFYK